MTLRAGMVALTAALALLVTADALAGVKIVQRTATVKQGSTALLRVKVSPAARCSIAVVYKSGRSSARGLGAKKGGLITWTWTVGGTTTPGRWPITVSCGSSGTLKTAVRVTRR